MPLGTICISTIGGRPRTWSSYSNIRAKDAQDISDMNSTDDILVYKDPNEAYPSPTLAKRRLGYSYDFPEKSQKKEKKWSISSIFRRKKKDESDSSSEEECQKKGFLGRRRKPESRRRKPKTLGTFDHVVIPPGPKNSMNNGYHCNEESGVLSDPSGGFSHYIGRALPQIPTEGDSCQKMSRESLNDCHQSKVSIRSGSGSVDSVRKSRKEMTKVRAEARRTSSKNGSSSEEESQRSNSSLKFRSDENLQTRDSSSNRRSRAARTERYLKRHSRDGENPHNYLRLSKSDAENSSANWKQSDDSNRSPSRSPLVPSSVIPTYAKNELSFSSLNSSSNISGLSTIPPSHGNHAKYRVSNSTSNPSYKPPQSMNEYNSSMKRSIDSNIDKHFIEQRSISCDANIHVVPSSESPQGILHVQFPISRANVELRNRIRHDSSQPNKIRQPPPPPPRDPSRVGNHFHENTRSRPNTFYFDGSGQVKSKSFTSSHAHPGLQQTRKFNSFNLHPSYRSTSEDHLPRDTQSVQLTARPSSTTPDANGPQRYITRRSDARAVPDNFNYLTDKHPRSRKPIFIQPSDSIAGNSDNNEAGSQKALDFWKQIDRQNTTPNKPILKKTRSDSPQMFTSHTQVQTKIFAPSVLQHDIMKPSSRVTSPFKPGTPTMPETARPLEISYQAVLGEESQDDIKRKSSNLEEALDELEAIYNSLRLGDEDLLERAEQREKESQNKKLPIDLLNSYPSYTSRGAMSDSSFSYEPFGTVDSPRKKRIIRKNRTLDIKQDDMAFRKMNNSRANTISDPQSHISKISYLQSSPVFSKDHQEEEASIENNNEPDITKDDVVYRNVRHMNNSLKVVDPQPPFGIPIGPITPGANSDYLHAKPEDIFTPIFKPRKIPDIVKDDLAFRNLRKDDNKRPALPPLSSEDFKNNNSDTPKFDPDYFRKKRARRSLSANIGSLMHYDIIDRAKLKQKQGNDVENEFKTLTDIADAMEIARSVLKEKENKITNTRKAFMSDTDAKYIHPNTQKSTMLECRQNFFNSLRNSHENQSAISKPSSPRLGKDKLSSKPPRGQTPERIRSPKESTPIPLSPLEDKQALNSESTSSSLEDLLNALAEEAKETTERITNELNILREERDTKKESMEKAPVVGPQEDEVMNNENRNDKLSEIVAARLCGNLLECVVDSNDLIVSTKSEDEIAKKIDEEAVVAESANVVMSRTGSKEDNMVNEESEHDYENLVSDKELNLDEVGLLVVPTEVEDPEEYRSSFEEHKAELIASFQELKEHMDDIKLPLRRADDENIGEIDQPSTMVDSVHNLDTVDKDVGTGEEVCSSVVAVQVEECAFTINTNTFDSDQLFASNCEVVLRKPVGFNLRDDSETSSGFNSICSSGYEPHCTKSEVACDEIDNEASSNLHSLESLKSPKLVMETSSKVSVLERSGSAARTFNIPGTSRDDFSRISLVSRRFDRSDRHILDDAEKPTPSWYRDPASVAFACSYGIACAHQLASIDLFAILSIMFAVISFIAALFL